MLVSPAKALKAPVNCARISGWLVSCLLIFCWCPAARHLTPTCCPWPRQMILLIRKSLLTCPKIYRADTWWRHQMETVSASLAFCAGNSLVTGEFPSQRPVTQSLGVFFICVWTNNWGNNRETGDLRRHHAHYDVTVMFTHHGMIYQNVIILTVHVPRNFVHFCKAVFRFWIHCCSTWW